MSRDRVIPQNLIRGESVPAATSWTYLHHHSINQMLRDDYFLGVQHQLNAGDTLRLVQLKNALHSDKSDQQVLCFIDLLIAASRRGKILFHRSTEEPIYPIHEDQDDDLPAQTSRPIYVEGEGEATWRGPNGKWAVVVDGEVLLSGIEDKDLAVSIASGKIPIPAVPAAG